MEMCMRSSTTMIENVNCDYSLISAARFYQLFSEVYATA